MKTQLLLIFMLLSNLLISQTSLPLTGKYKTSNVTCFEGSDGYINISVKNGVPPYHFLWSNGSTTEDLMNISAGNYSITITDENNSSISKSFTITEPSEIVLGEINGENVLCDYISNGLTTYKVDAINGIINYNWSVPQGVTIFGGQGTNIIEVYVDYTFISGTISVIGTTDCGLSKSSSKSVTILPKTPSFDIVPTNINFDEPVLFSVNHTNNTNYLWTVPYGSVDMSNSDSSSILVKFSQSFVGGYLEVQSENNCGVSETNSIYVDSIRMRRIRNPFNNVDIIADNPSFGDKPNIDDTNEQKMLSNETITINETRIYNYPNPMSYSTRFQVTLGRNFSETNYISIRIYNVRGQIVKTITSRNNNGQGTFNTETWDSKDENGNELTDGIYYYTVIAKDNNGILKTIKPNSNIQIIR